MTYENIDVDFIQELVESGASGEALSRLTNDEKAVFVKLKREMKMPAIKKKATTAKSKVVAKKAPTKVVKTEETISKADKARAIFAKHFNKLPRKDIIAMFIADCDMGKNYSNTLYQNEKKKFENTEK